MILKASSQTEFAIALAEAAQPVMALIERDPDLAIFQVVKQGTTGKSQGISRAVHSAIASTLAARRLNWSPIDAQRSFKAALTMNISVLDLQAKLANQTTPLTPAQREAIQAHPHESVKMLEASGVTDRDWLVGVEQHHEEPDGSGYPKKLIDITDIATLLRSADIYTAKLAGRAGRSAMMADAAARNFFTARTQHPVTAALIKEFGLYPPGSYVRLVTGEFGIVIKRGEQVTTPIVAALTNRSGDSLHEPMRRNCADKTYAIAAVVPESALRVRVSSEKLVVLASQ
jgi:hypothetical protein